MPDKLMLSNVLLDTLSEISIIGVCIYQKEGKIIFANDTFCNMLEYPKEELLHKIKLQQLLEGKDKKEAIKAINRRTKGEKFTREFKEILYRTKDGFLKPALTFGYTVMYNNEPSGLVIVVDALKQKTYETLYKSLSEINHIITGSENEENLLKSVCDSLYRVAGFDPVCIGTVDENTKLFIPKYIRGDKAKVKYLKQTTISVDPNLKEGQGSVGRAYRGKRIATVNNVYKDKGMSAWRSSQSKFGLYSVCSIPLFKHNKIEYILVMYSKIPGIFSKEYYSLLENIQIDISAALEAIEIQRWNSILTKAINSGFDFLTVTDSRLNILYVNDNTEKLLGHPKDKLIGQHISFILPKIQIEEERPSISSETYTKRTPSGESKPLKLLVNTIPVKLNGGYTYYISTGKNISNNAALRMTIEQILKTDSLTGLYNRAAFKDAVEQFITRAKYKGVMGVVAVINPVRFSMINDAYGFTTGNKVLIEIAKRIKNTLREYDVVARLESEKFAVLLEDIEREEDIFVILMNLLKHLSNPYIINDKTIRLSFNAGITIYPQDAQDPDQLMEKAGIALIDARTKGKSTLGFYKDRFRREAEKKVQLENEAMEAIKNREFVLYYQPYFNLEKRTMSGAETLVRWMKKGKIVPPSEFIPLLEETRSIIHLEEWITAETLKNLKEWKDRFPATVPISINISPFSLSKMDFVENILSSISDFGVTPELLNIEITERLFLENLEYSKEILKTIKHRDIKISIDDFGTGYSSLSYLTQLPVDFIKIDISFIRQITHDSRTKAVVKAVVYLAKELNMKTIAEGVETKEQLQVLEKIGCDYAQGFALSKPVSKEEFESVFLCNLHRIY